MVGEGIAHLAVTTDPAGGADGVHARCQ